MPPTVLIVAYATVVAALSLVVFVAYGIDRRRAAEGGFRISERTLQLLALLGGWPGAWLGQRLFRHKTRKLGFQLVFWMVVVTRK